MSNKTTWDLQIVPKDSALYEALRLNGYQPFHFTLIPVPQAAQPQIITPNGDADGYMKLFVQVIGMRKELPITDDDRRKVEELKLAYDMKAGEPPERTIGPNRLMKDVPGRGIHDV